MNPEPKFTEAITAGRKRDEQEALARKQAEQSAREDKARRASMAAAHLEVIVKPHLIQAHTELMAERVAADLGNGKDSYGETRLSLTMSARSGRPTLVFTAITKSASPHLGWHNESATLSNTSLPHRITDPTDTAIIEIIRDFLA
jgi:hypothetical protein